jgi:6-pyruvoyl-tetrahydropterin synthase
MVYLTRIEHFNAAHKLYNPNWTKEKNNEVFGKCANENWHGHNFELYVTIKGQPDPETGFIYDANWEALVQTYHRQTGPPEPECGCGFYARKNVFDRKPGSGDLE